MVCLPFTISIQNHTHKAFRTQNNNNIIYVIIRHNEWKSLNWKMKSQILRYLNAEQYALGLYSICMLPESSYPNATIVTA